MDPVRGVTMRQNAERLGEDMKAWRETADEENGTLRLTFYLLAALCVGICVALLIIVERL